MVRHTVKLGTLLHVVEIFLHLFLLLGSSYLLNIFALWSQNHEGYTKHSIGTGGEDGKLHVAVLYREYYLCTLRTANPVLLGFLDTIAPLDGLQTVEQTLRVSRCSQTPLLHLFLDDRKTATLTYAVYYLVVGKHSTRPGHQFTMFHPRLSDAVVHQNLLLLHVVVAVPLLGCEVNLLVLSYVQVSRTFSSKRFDELLDRLSLLAAVAEE